jgi:hypothetical protein
MNIQPREPFAFAGRETDNGEFVEIFSSGAGEVTRRLPPRDEFEHEKGELLLACKVRVAVLLQF